jgi:hypothetical protein
VAIELTMDAVVAAVVVRGVCGVLRTLLTERGATDRRRIEAAERMTVARLEVARLERSAGPPLAVAASPTLTRSTPSTRPSATWTRGA